MGSETPESPEPRRGRVVMLVNNGVDGDSRVQKSAASAAAAGWEVCLLGSSPDMRRRTWWHEGAEVRLLPKPSPLSVRAHDVRSPVLRRPLAYRDSRKAAQRAQWVKAYRADLRVRRDALALRARQENAPLSVPLRTAGLAVPRAASRVLGRWVALRTRQLASVQRRRGSLDSAADHMAVAFWKVALRRRAWQRLVPHLLDFDLAFAKEIDKLAPDLIHAHDYHMLGVAARAVVRARAEGRSVKLVWDAHEYVPGLNAPNPRWLAGVSGYERAHAAMADAVVTVSRPLAELLRKNHGLPELPTVTLNAPVAVPPAEAHGEDAEPVPDLRELCGIDASTPLVVYLGGISPARGVGDVIEALRRMPGVHLALVSKHPQSGLTPAARAVVGHTGIDERIHVLPYVPYWQVVPFVEPADVAVSPLHHLANHEIALSNKFFEYSQARLPLVVSDVRTMAETVRATGQGEVFRAEDPEDCARALRAVLADPARYRAAYDAPGLLEQWTWEAQGRKLDGLYTRLLADGPADGLPDGLTDDPELFREGDENADLCGGAREDRAAAGRPVRGQGTSRDGRRRGRPRGAAGEGRDGALPR
ncbi:hypothetical protein GCM10009801_57350 [Streptomyces albiaxialis]|uniref:D-inositol 3-phosphate glycosyltransferase n=1 Tax=Streptomyces albiaxialis TaxID=329523 RepID=A0ABP5I2I5_9ACTN